MDENNIIAKSRIALHNASINVEAIAKEFCLEYEHLMMENIQLPNGKIKSKETFFVTGTKELRMEFFKAIKERIESKSITQK